MALPKEPRQKMVNMMYLVLTALLALNVSSEILNAFKTVNTSITNANGVIDSKNAAVYTSFEQMIEDPKTAEKAKFWQPFADEARKHSAAMDAYLNDLKLKLKKESGLKVEDGVEHFKEDNLDASSRMFDKQGEGEKLYKKLEEYKKNLLGTLDPNKFSDPVLKKSIADKRAELEKTLPLDLKTPPSQTGSTNKDWSASYFHMTPTIAALTILSKFQNDVKNSESQVVDYFLSQVGSVKVVFDAFEPLIGTNATYLMPGQELEIKAGIGAFSKSATPTITINGTTPPLQNGSAVYKTVVNGAGEKSVRVNIRYVKPDGSTDEISRDIKYTVGVPSGASVFLEKMNVMYIGVDNPVTVSGGSVGSEKVSISFSNGSYTRAGGDRYIFRPKSQGPATLTVNADGKTYSFPMRVKRLPDPTAMVGPSKGGTIAAATFKAQGGMIARLLDSDFDAPFQVVSYVLGANGGPFQTYQQAANDGARWSGNAAAIVSKAAPGASVFFDQIRVKGPDGATREIPPIIFQLK
jgi:gliding motility-associated protein GldM